MKLQLSIVAVTLALTGCVTTGTAIRSAQDKVGKEQQKMDRVLATVEESKVAAVPHYKRVSGLWLSDRVVTGQTDADLPKVFDTKVVLRDRRRLNVADVAEFIRSKTGVNVVLVGEQIGSDAFTVDHVGTVQELLDSVTSRLAMTWQWQDNTLMIQQSQVQTFTVRQAGLSSIGSSSAGRLDPWAEIQNAIRTISPNSRMSLVRSANAITVADRPANMKRIAELLELTSASADRQVIVHWQLINITARQGAEAGLNLNYILNRAGGRLSLASPGSLASTNAGALQLTSTGANSNGSTAALSLLNEAGTVYVVGENVEAVKHNTRRSFGIEREITYNAESTPGLASASTTSASVGIKKSQVKVGLNGVFGVSVHDSEQMDLMFDFSVKVLDQLRADTSAGYLLESPETSKRLALAEEGVRVRHGNTYILSAEQSLDISFDRRGLLPGNAAILGGSEKASEKRSLWLLLVTPIITQRGV
jgi:hypothetical protein